MADKMRLSRPGLNVLFRIGVCLLVLATGVGGMIKLSDLKTPPREKRSREKPLEVEVIRVQPEDVPIVLSGYGEVSPLDVVSIAPEVSGRIVAIHPDLESGEVIAEGEDLFSIDPIDYQAAVQESEAAVSQARAQIRQLQEQYRLDQSRLKTLKRNKELARDEFERQRSLFAKEMVSRSGVEQAEQAANLAGDQYDQLALAVELLPIKIKEAESGLDSALARLDLARANLKRCTVQAPFQARVKSVQLEKGQHVTPGQSVLTLADDSTLEIQVPLDSREARKWLQFEAAAPRGNTWFESIEQVPCQVLWTEDRDGHVWEGFLHRVVRFEAETRTLKLAVRIRGDALDDNGRDRFPLVEGMFCRVSIPGKTIRDVFRLPGAAVGFEGTVFQAVDHRLKTVNVDILRTQAGETLVSGLAAGDLVVTTRLVDPLENSLLDYQEPDKESRS
ncbi:MAG: efflux RND transporter periplasmic adaptor subunit [Thermodesulfobacteriota bacterium]